LTTLVIGACSSASKSSSTAATVAPAPPTTTSSGSAPATSSGAAPAVANATDLKTEPKPAAGTSPAPTTLVMKDLVTGSGPAAVASSTVNVQYVGTNYTDGKVFDASWEHGGQPISFALSGVIPGFAQGIVGMKVGGRRELVIPPDLGYGPQGSPPAVGPNETLVFVIDLVGVQ